LKSPEERAGGVKGNGAGGERLLRMNVINSINVSVLIRISKHAEDELMLRKIPVGLFKELLSLPEEKLPADKGREAWQSLFVFPNGKTYLLRAIIERSSTELVVVTVYKTNRIEKYRRK